MIKLNGEIIVTRFTTPLPGQFFFATRMPTRDLFAVANLLLRKVVENWFEVDSEVGLGDGSLSVGFSKEAAAGILENGVPQKLEHFVNGHHCT